MRAGLDAHAQAARVLALAEQLEADPRFREVAFIAEANHMDVVPVLAERNLLKRAARLARARVITAEHARVNGKR